MCSHVSFSITKLLLLLTGSYSRIFDPLAHLTFPPTLLSSAIAAMENISRGSLYVTGNTIRPNFPDGGSFSKDYAYTMIICLFTGLLAYSSWRVFYNLYLHPLSKFPGPRLAAAGHTYEFYYDVVKRGMYMSEIGRMHDKYGPIVRITPRELHIKDGYYLDQIYPLGNQKRDKDSAYVPAFVSTTSMISTIDHDHHRYRKSLLLKFFSKQSVMKLEPYIQGKADEVANLFCQAHERNQVLDAQVLFAGLTADVISHYAFGQCFEALGHPESGNVCLRAANGAVHTFHFNRFFPLFRYLIDRIPSWLAVKIQKKGANLIDGLNSLYKNSNAALEDRHSKNLQGPKTIFDALADPSVLVKERSITRLMDEAFVILGAGTLTTARVLALIAFHLASNKQIAKSLRDELRAVMPLPNSLATWNELEHLPYLSGVVSEALRLTAGLTMRQPRIATSQALVYGDYVIPPGTPVSQSAYLLHTDPSLFPDPHAFRPERWIESAEKGMGLQRFLFSFSKGSRQCIGMNLAYCEMLISTAQMARRFDMELFETTADDVKIVRDLGIGFPKSGPFKVQVKVTGVASK